jgi:hypothetical protein
MAIMRFENKGEMIAWSLGFCVIAAVTANIEDDDIQGGMGVVCLIYVWGHALFAPLILRLLTLGMSKHLYNKAVRRKKKNNPYYFSRFDEWKMRRDIKRKRKKNL